MQSGPVVEGFDVVKDSSASLGASSKAAMIDQLVFDAAPKGFDKGVVVAVISATHGSDEVVLCQDLAISGAGELAAPIGMKDEGALRPTLT